MASWRITNSATFVLLLFLSMVTSNHHNHVRTAPQHYGVHHPHQYPRPRNEFLAKLLGISPVVLLVDQRSMVNSGESQDQEEGAPDVELLREGDDDVLSQKPVANEAYMLYNALRSTQDNGDIDEKTFKKLEGAKLVLKKALIARCGQKNQCQQKCQQKKKPSGCQANCQKVFDEMDACDEPPKEEKCGKKNKGCGGGRAKTMPPYWLRSLLESKSN